MLLAGFLSRWLVQSAFLHLPGPPAQGCHCLQQAGPSPTNYQSRKYSMDLGAEKLPFPSDSALYQVDIIVNTPTKSYRIFSYVHISIVYSRQPVLKQYALHNSSTFYSLHIFKDISRVTDNCYSKILSHRIKFITVFLSYPSKALQTW